MIKKSNIAILFVLFTFLSIEFSQVAFTFSDGPPAGYTGEPLEFTCSDGVGCHGGVAMVNPNMADFTFSDASGNIVSDYIPGDTYTITVDINGAPATGCYGFQLLNVIPPGFTVGTFNAIPGTQIISSGSRTYIEHDVPEVSGNWVFTWTAPSTDVGNIEWYMGANAANCNAQSTGDVIYLASKTLTAPNCPVDFDLVLLSPGFAFADCDYSTDEPRLWVKLSNFSGPNAPYTISALGGELSCTIAYPGDTIDYFFSSADLDSALTAITVDNGSGICTPWDSLTSAFQGFPIDLVCAGPLQCGSNVVANYATNNNLEPMLTCSSDSTMLELIVSSVTGGNGSYTVTSTGGSVSPAILNSGQGFTYSISQADIDSYNTVVTIDDGNGCSTSIDMKGQLKNTIIADYCSSCADYITETSQSIITNNKSANISIMSNGNVPSAAVIEYSAGTCIELLPNFEVKLGAEFDAFIGPCN